MENPLVNQNSRRIAEETVFSWLWGIGVKGFKSLPSMARQLAIQVGVVLAFQLVFWYEGISKFIPDIIKMPVIFLTATYNDVIPKTIYWVIVFTFGKKLLNKFRTVGLTKTLEPLKGIAPSLRNALKDVGEKANIFLLGGAGLGLIIANNFASYSRFSGARNKFDKYFIALVISFTISYFLGEGRDHWLFKFGRLSVSDLNRWFKLKLTYNEQKMFLVLSGFVLGLLADFPLILFQMMYGGYIVGALVLGGAIALSFAKPQPKAPHVPS